MGAKVRNRGWLVEEGLHVQPCFGLGIQGIHRVPDDLRPIGVLKLLAPHAESWWTAPACPESWTAWALQETAETRTAIGEELVLLAGALR